MTKTNYKVECKRQKDQISELLDQITTLKERLDVLRKAKSQTILKTEIINRQICEPQFGSSGLPNTTLPQSDPQPSVIISTKDCATNTDPGQDPPPKQPTPEPELPKRTQRKRVKDNWSQCTIHAETKYSQVEFVQTCHCEGVGEKSALVSQPPTPVPKTPVTLPKIETPVTLPKIETPSNVITCKNSPVPDFGTKTKTKHFISTDEHALAIKAIESAYKLEREKQFSIHSKELVSLRHTIEQLNDALRASVSENVKQTITAPNGASVFHLYAEEKRRMEDQVRGVNTENHKLKAKLKKLTLSLQEKEEEWEENEEAIKKHYVETWDSQYRSWMNKTESKMDFLRSSNENMQTFIMRNARHLPFAATDELKIFNEYGEKVTVFQ